MVEGVYVASQVPDSIELRARALRLVVPPDERDRARRAWLRDEQGWMIEPVTKENVFGPQRDIEAIVLTGLRNARRRL